MSTSTLLLQAKADLKTAVLCVDNKDKYVRLHAAYCVQQSIEKTLKYLISQDMIPALLSGKIQ